MVCRYKLLLAEVDDKGVHDALKLFEYHIRTKNLTPKTISVYGERLGYFHRFLRDKKTPLEEVTRTTIQDYILYQKDRGLADISINGQVKVLKIFFKYLKEEEVLATDPMERIDLLKTEKRDKAILSREQVVSLLAVPDRSSFIGMRNFVMVLVFYDTLIRLSELLNLRLEDMDLDAGTLAVMGKGRKARHVPMGMKTVKQLHKYITKYQSQLNTPFAFTTSKGHPLDQRNVIRILERIGRRAGVHVSPHLLRHTGASHRALDGMPAFLLQRLLGHATIHMTQRYVHLVDDERLKVAFQKYSPIDAMQV